MYEHLLCYKINSKRTFLWNGNSKYKCEKKKKEELKLEKDPKGNVEAQQGNVHTSEITD